MRYLVAVPLTLLVTIIVLALVGAISRHVLGVDIPAWAALLSVVFWIGSTVWVSAAGTISGTLSRVGVLGMSACGTYALLLLLADRDLTATAGALLVTAGFFLLWWLIRQRAYVASPRGQ